VREPELGIDSCARATESVLPELARRDVVLFDAGGTLISLDHDRVGEALGDGEAMPPPECLEAAEARARRWADDGVRSQMSARELWNGYFERLLTDAGLAEGALRGVIERLWAMNAERSLWRVPVPGARTVLETLRAAGRRLAVVSNAEGNVERDLLEAGFGGLLETVVDSHRVGVAKPDPRIFEVALDRLGVESDRCLYVGDVPAFDVAGALAAGIPPVLVDPWDAYPDTPVVRIAGLAELPSLLGL
jgi:putative hydrolase of the HAD superfamily